ncbi:hypothetical protein JHK86_010078 [Glycine max]|nr:hypothetical protein JHK86_010078 [Glycine max]
MVISRICKRLELWKEVESNTIDMMIENDFSREDKEGDRKNSHNKVEDSSDLDVDKTGLTRDSIRTQSEFQGRTIYLVDTAGWLKRTKQEKGEHPSALCNQGRVYSRLI